ncbi:AIR synthase related protein [Caldisalinibacter kiritimatiensis]|uniref:Putative alpha-ribazole-5-phosphate synthase CblS for cobalamin biosynthesis n=1 Tax=Caldisalinibacter kiritimatiensis TaxID=1304284 RepID=R1CNW4_9FIRM|nr:AIR synthase related protein [Caldisalinibacter kiritimatiensis]EOD00391.1 Putative alpha-ribazole-5-phosphate synthase CblS for cobalamin biosynthesis [Caldisalinibacter kiritimatiensis]
MNVKKFRDLTFISINENQYIVISCDSSGGIGNKEKDIVKVSPEKLGYYTTNVALRELLAIKARPITIVNTLSVEMNNTGKKIIEGIKRAIEPLEYFEDIIITGSTEENFPVCQTGMGITVVGIIDKTQWKQPKTTKGSLAVVVGIPKVGEEVVHDKEKETLTLEVLLQLCKETYIQEILPVGSKGILYELSEIARTNNLLYGINEDITLDLNKSAGPATCAIVTVEQKYYHNLKKKCSIPINIIGKFV